MAFENVFGNVNYGMIPQARQAEASRLQQAIGQGLGQYNQAQDRELRARQLDIAQQAAEAKALAKPVDFKQQAQQALYNKLVSDGATPEQAAMGVMQQTAPVTRVYNPRTEQMEEIHGGWGGVDIGFNRVMGQPTQQTPVVNALGVPRPEVMATQEDVENVQPVITREDFDKAKGIVPTIEAPEGSLPSIKKAAAEANIDLAKRVKERQMESIFADQELNKVTQNEQKLYEDNLSRLLDGYRKLIEAGGAITTLEEDWTMDDVFENISARLGASPIGRAAGGAIGTKAEAARAQTDTVVPLMFGNLRKILGMTGKELDTQQERDFYLKSLTSPKSDISTNLDVIEALSKRFGTGDTSKKVGEIRGLIGKKPEEKPGWSIKLKSE